jgi:hypothetical protein
LKEIKCKTFVVATSKDGIHKYEEVEKLALMLLDAELIDLETNEQTHGLAMASLVEHFWDDIPLPA